MSKNRIITLLTDFGLQDVYVGVMKGAIAQINSAIQMIDITHQIPPQNVAAARFCLMNAYPYFPSNTVHIAVVDPGVGSQRKAIAVKFSDGYFVGPDNGLVSGILNLSSVVAVVELTNKQYWRTSQLSNTFHGRDIFAAVGAYLASGIPLENLGNTIAPDNLVQLPISECKVIDTEIVGCIQYIDHFGNLITNIPATLVEGKSWSVSIGNLAISSRQTYSDSEIGSLVALVGSHGWVEIAVNGGSAKSRLKLDWGDPVGIYLNN